MFSDNAILFAPEKLKTARPGHRFPIIEFQTYRNIKSFLVLHLKQYIALSDAIQEFDDK